MVAGPGKVKRRGCRVEAKHDSKQNIKLAWGLAAFPKETNNGTTPRLLVL